MPDEISFLSLNVLWICFREKATMFCYEGFTVDVYKYQNNTYIMLINLFISSSYLFLIKLVFLSLHLLEGVCLFFYTLLNYFLFRFWKQWLHTSMNPNLWSIVGSVIAILQYVSCSSAAIIDGAETFILPLFVVSWELLSKNIAVIIFSFLVTVACNKFLLDKVWISVLYILLVVNSFSK